MDTALHGERIRIEHIPLAQVVLWDRNPKAHDIGNITESIRRYGFQDPPKFDAALEALVYGNGRSHCLRMMQKAKEDVPRGILVDDAGAWYVPVKFGLDLESKRTAEAFAIDHNNLTMAGNFEVWETAKIWDEESYAALLEEMANEDVFAVTVDGDDLDALLREFRDDEPPEDPGVQIDKAEELNETWQVKAGDLWEIPSQATPGKSHRLLCGDSTKAEDVERLMGGEKADAVVTDPPYGINHDTDYTRFSGGLSDSRSFEKPIYGDNLPFDPSALLEHKQVILWGANAYSNSLPCGSWLVWDKRQDGQEKLLSDGEVAWLNRGHGVYIFNHTWNGFVRESEHGKTLHPTQKPVALFEWCFTHLKNCDLVFDPYCGSGPIAVAAERTARICYGMEIEPKYCAVALERMAGMGLEPHRIEG